MTAIIQFENVHNQRDKGASERWKAFESVEEGEEEGQVLSWWGRNCQNEFQYCGNNTVTELYTGLELPCNRETLSQQFGTVNGNACSLLGSGYDIRYCFANCSTDGLRISFRLELVKRPAVNNQCSRVQQVWHRLRNERWNKRVRWLLRWWNLIERKSNRMSILLPFLVKRV